MDLLTKISLKNKIFFSTLAVIVLLSIVIALLARWILVSGLTDGLKQRGLSIAYGVAEGCRSHMLTENIPELTCLMFDARQGERSPLIAYVFVVDKQNRVLAHSLITELPKWLPTVNTIYNEMPYNIKEIEVNAATIYDIAVPVKEGLYQIGTVHVGLQKSHIDTLINRLRNTFLGFIVGITVLFFWISHVLSTHVTRPIFQLVHIADEISRGNLDIQPDLGRVVRCRGASNGAIPPRIGDEVVHLATSFTHMTERLKLTEAKIRRSEGNYRSLFNSGPNPIFVLDRETLEILDANPSAEETYGYLITELKGMAFSNLGGLELSRLKQLPFSALAGPKDYVVMEKERHTTNGNRPIYVRLKACPARYRDREAIMVATTDITEFIEKEAYLVQAGKMTTLGEMSAGIAHELNQPLNAIRMGSDYLKMMVTENRPIADSDLAELADAMNEQVDRASQIINHLRNFGRKSDLAQHPVRFNEPIESVLAIIGQQLHLQNIGIKWDFDDTLPPVLANRNHLEQVFFNLISNARDAIIQSQLSGTRPRPGEIRIAAFRENDRAVATVTDNGTGIPEEIMDRIFEPFFTTKDVGKGMGLGLSIIYGLVRDHGGRIEVESKAGEYTTFKLSFPLMNPKGSQYSTP